MFLFQKEFQISNYLLIGDSEAKKFFTMSNTGTITILQSLLSDSKYQTSYTVSWVVTFFWLDYNKLA